MNTPKYLSDPYYSTSKLKKIPLLLSEKYCDIVFEDADTEQEQAANLLILQRVLGQVRLGSRVEQKLNTSHFKPLCSSKDFNSYMLSVITQAERNKGKFTQQYCDAMGDAKMQFMAASNLITFCGIDCHPKHVKGFIYSAVSWGTDAIHIRYPGLRGAEIVMVPRKERYGTGFICYCFIICHDILIYYSIINQGVYKACTEYFPKISMSKSDVPSSNIISVGDKIPWYYSIGHWDNIPDMRMIVISDHKIKAVGALDRILQKSMGLPLVNSADSPVLMMYSPLDSVMYYVNNSDESGNASQKTDGLILHRIDTGRHRLDESDSIGSDEHDYRKYYTDSDAYFKKYFDSEMRLMKSYQVYDKPHESDPDIERVIQAFKDY